MSILIFLPYFSGLGAAQIIFTYLNIKQMSSVSRSPQNTSQGDAFFVNITNFVPGAHTLDASGNAVEVDGIDYTTTYAPGAMFLRDMGKTIRVPGQTTNEVWSGRLRTLRKVQFVGRANQVGFPVTNGFINYNEGVAGAQDVFAGALPSGYATFYVDLNHQNDSGPVVRFARLSVQ